MRFKLGCAPGKLDFRLHAVLAQVSFGEVYHFGGNAFASQILDRFDGRVLCHRQHPPGRLARHFAEQKLTHLVDLGIVFLNPIVAGNPAIQIAVLDVAADFLRANQADFHLLVVHVRNVRAGVDLNVEAGFRHFFNGRVLQAAFGQSKT